MRPNGFKIFLISAAALGSTACGASSANTPAQTDNNPKVEEVKSEPTFADDTLIVGAIGVGFFGIGAMVVGFNVW